MASTLVASVLLASVRGQNPTFELDWESGFPDGSPALSPALEPSFSINIQSNVDGCSNSGNEITECKCGVGGYSPRNCDTYLGISSLHGHEVLTGLDWARKGQGVLKIYADGRERGLNDYVPSGRYASNRAEIGSIGYTYLNGDDVYYTASFYLPSENWDQVSRYSTVITQWKMTSDPHGALRVSNLGDYKLYYRGGEGLWEQGDEGREIATIQPDQWNDVKIYYRKATGSDGIVRVYLNGEQVFQEFGRNMLGVRSSGGGYVKFGMYTEIRDERVIYFDAVGMTSDLASIGFGSEADWVAEHQDKPSVSITVENTNSQEIMLSATAVDPDGIGGPGSVAKVSFYVQGGCLVAEDASYPYSATFNPPTDGLHEFSARVTDQDGNVASSTVVSVRSGNAPPTATITSHSTGDDVAGGSVNLAASTTQGDGAIVDVKFYAIQNGNSDAVLLGTATSSPYSISWTPEGNYGYTIYVVATDTNSKTGESAHIRIAVGTVLSTATLRPTDDASLLEGSPNNNANWGEVEIYTKPTQVWIAGIFKVDASSLAGAADIRSAELRVYVVTVKDGGPWNFAIWSTAGAESWDENSVTWNNAPDPQDRLQTVSISSTGWVEFDVSEYLNARLQAGGDLSSITFWIQGDDNNYERIEINSVRESNLNRPEFVVQHASVAKITRMIDN